MAVRNYFELGISSGTTKKFKAREYKPALVSPGEIRKDLMNQFCGIRGFEHWSADIVAKCRRLDQENGFGNREDLLEVLSHPGFVVYVDFDGDSHEETLIVPGSFPSEAISTILEGDAAWVLTPFSLVYQKESYP